MGKPEGKRPHGRFTCILGYNIKIDLKWEGVDWIYLTEDRYQWQSVVNTVMNFRVS